MECPDYNDLYDEYIRIKNGEAEIYTQHIANCEKCKCQMMFIEEIYNVAEESYKEKYNGCLEPEKLISFADNKVDKKNRINFINKILTCKHCKKVFVDLKKLSKESNSKIINIVKRDTLGLLIAVLLLLCILPYITDNINNKLISKEKYNSIISNIIQTVNLKK